VIYRVMSCQATQSKALGLRPDQISSPNTSSVEIGP
jgi:hypothetical protein